MTMTIGEKIKQLRQESGITQEKLAEYLNITYQSISKWENNNALPDVTLIVPLANFFGITTDELFDRDTHTGAAEIEALCKRDYDLAHTPNQDTIRERVVMWREAVQKYPKDFRCLKYLAYALHATLDSRFEESEFQANARELIPICERILRDCTDQEIRDSAIQLLVMTYSWPYSDMADEDMAVKYANMAGGIYTCREVLLEHAYAWFTEDGRKKQQAQKHFNNLVYMDFLCSNIVHPDPPCSHEDMIFVLETAVKLWETLVYDGNLLFYHCRVGRYCVLLAKHHAALGHGEEALSWLEKAYYHVSAFDGMPPEVDIPYTSLFVREATASRHPLDGCMEDLKRDMGAPCFDGIRQTSAFQALFEKLN